MNIKELITDLRARINPQYYDQIGTESYERLGVEHDSSKLMMFPRLSGDGASV